MDTTAETLDSTGTYRLGRDRRYLVWLTSDTATGLSGTLAGFAIPLIALAVTGSPVQAGIIGAVGLTARLITTPLGGVLADRHARFTLMTIGAVAGLTLALAFAGLAAADSLTFVALLILSTLLSARGGLFEVAGEAAIKQIVPSSAMGRAQAANQGRDAALGLAGGPLGGLLLGVGAWAVGLAMIVCQSLAVISALILRRTPRIAPDGDDTSDAAAGTASPATMWAQVREGIVWVFSRPDLRGVLLVSTIVNLGFTTVLTSVTYSLQLSGHTPQQIGILSAITAVAMLVGAAVSPLLVARISAGTLTIVGLSLCAAGVLAISLLEAFAAIAAAMAVAVLGIPALNAALLGYLTVATPSRLLGRVNSAVRVMAMGAMPMAPLIAGFGLAWMGRSLTIGLGGAICVVAVALTIATRALRELPAESEWAAHAAQFARPVPAPCA